MTAGQRPCNRKSMKYSLCCFYSLSYSMPRTTWNYISTRAILQFSAGLRWLPLAGKQLRLDGSLARPKPIAQAILLEKFCNYRSIRYNMVYIVYPLDTRLEPRPVIVASFKKKTSACGSNGSTGVTHFQPCREP